jgi:hypothetical protein
VLYTWASWLLEHPYLWELPPIVQKPAPAQPEPDCREAAAHAFQASEHAEAERQMQVCDVRLVIHSQLCYTPCIILDCSSHNKTFVTSRSVSNFPGDLGLDKEWGAFHRAQIHVPGEQLTTSAKTSSRWPMRLWFTEQPVIAPSQLFCR